MKEHILHLLLLLLILISQPVIAQESGTASFISYVSLTEVEPKIQHGYNITIFTFEINYQLYNPESSSKSYNMYKDCDGTSIDLYYHGNASEYHEYTCSRAALPRVLPPGISNYTEKKSVEMIINRTELPEGTYEFTAFAPLLGQEGEYTLTVVNDTTTLTSIKQPANYPNGTVGISSTMFDTGNITSITPLDSTILLWIPVAFLLYPIIRPQKQSTLN